MKWALGRKWDFCCCKLISQQSWEHFECCYWLHRLLVSLGGKQVCSLFPARLCRPTGTSRCRPPARSGAGACGCGPCLVPRHCCWSQPCILLLWCLMLVGEQGMMWITWSKENSGEWPGLRMPLLTGELKVSHAVENQVAHWRWHRYLWREIKLIHSSIWNLKKRG